MDIIREELVAEVAGKSYLKFDVIICAEKQRNGVTLESRCIDGTV